MDQRGENPTIASESRSARFKRFIENIVSPKRRSTDVEAASQPANVETIHQPVEILDLFDSDGNFSEMAFNRLSEKLKANGAAIILVHPWMYQNTDSVFTSEHYSTKYRQYIEKTRQTVTKALAAGLPAIILTETTAMGRVTENFGQVRDSNSARFVAESRDRLRHRLTEEWGIQDQEVFVVSTQAQSPVPLVSHELLNQLKTMSEQEAREYVHQNGLDEYYPADQALDMRTSSEDLNILVMQIFANRLKQAGMRRATLAGSYFGGLGKGKELVNIDQEKMGWNADTPSQVYQVVGTNQIYTEKAGSHYYLSSSTDNPRDGWLNITDRIRAEKGSQHPLAKISIRGCGPFLMRALEVAGIRIGLGSTFPESAPQASQLVLVRDESGQEFYVDKRQSPPLQQALRENSV